MRSDSYSKDCVHIQTFILINRSKLCHFHLLLFNQNLLVKHRLTLYQVNYKCLFVNLQVNIYLDCQIYLYFLYKREE